MKKSFSLISIIISSLIIISKLIIDFKSYVFLKKMIKETGGDLSPTVIAGGIKFTLLIISIPLILNILFISLGMFYKNERRFFALFIFIASIIFCLIPFSLLTLYNL